MSQQNPDRSDRISGMAGFADTALDPFADTQTPDAREPDLGLDIRHTSNRQKRAESATDQPSTPHRSPRYQVLGEHARGGLGRVLRARDTQLDRMVAIKEMLHISDLAESLFTREATVTARLQHPGVVSVIESGRWASGEPYYVMELISGQSLQALMAEPLTFERRLSLLPNVLAVTETMAYAHSQGVIHSDLKPSNIIIGAFGETLVVDWGLARFASSLAHAHTDASAPADSTTPDGDLSFEPAIQPERSLTGKIMGTPRYMSPEQAHGRRADERTDVYALGALLYELLGGKPTYHGAPRRILEKLLIGPPPPLHRHAPDVPDDLQTIVAKAMAPRRDQRYTSARDLADDLKRFQAGQWVTAHRYSFWAVVKRWSRRHRSAVGVALFALALVGALGAVSVSRIITERDRATVESERARSARAAAVARQNELVLLQAESALDQDPTTAIAWLQQLSLGDDNFTQARELFIDASSQGVARHSFVHDGWVSDVAFNRDGTRLFSASRDGTLRVHDLDTGVQTRATTGQRSVDVVTVAPSGAWLASNRGDHQVLVWPMRDGIPDGQPRVLDGHRDRVMALAFSADSARLVSHDTDGVAFVWNVETGASLSTQRVGEHVVTTSNAERVLFVVMDGGTPVLIGRDIAADTESVRVPLPDRPLEIAISPDDVHVAVYGAAGFMWQVDTHTEAVTKLDDGRISVMQASFPVRYSPSGRYLVAGEPSRAVHLWDVHAGAHRLLRGHTDAVFDFAFSSDETMLVTAGDDATVRLWDLASFSTRTLRGHTDDVMRVAINPGGDMVATASKDGHVRVWPIETASRRLSGHAGTVSGMIIESPDRLLTTTRNGEIRRWTLGSDTSELLAPSRAHINIYRSFVSPNGGLISVFDNRTRTLDLWNMHTDVRFELTGHEHQIFYVSYAANERWMTTIDRVGVSKLWSLSGDTPTMRRRDRDVCGAALSPAGDELALVKRTSIEFWRLPEQTLTEALQLPGTIEWCADITRAYAEYTPDGEYVAIVASPWGLLLDGRRDGTRQWLDIGSHLVNAMRFSADSTRLAAGVHDRSVRVWNVATGASKILGRHGDMIMDVMFSPDGSALASASYDHTVRLWHLHTDRKRVLRSHNASVDRLLFTPDGNRLLSSSRDRTIRLWDMGIEIIADRHALRARIAAATTVSIHRVGHAYTATAD